MTAPANIESVVGQYVPLDLVDRIDDLGGAGGFSGARLWRIHRRNGSEYAVGTTEGRDLAADFYADRRFSAAGSVFCLRRWPAGHPAPDRLAWIHRILLGVHREARLPVAVPLPSRGGSTILVHGGALWELTAWMPGHADFAARPSRNRVLAALRFLADFHDGAARIDGAVRTAVPEVVGARLRQLDECQRSLAAQLAQVPPDDGWPALRQLVRPTVELFRACAERIRVQLVNWKHAVPIVPCVRDIWHAHLFFLESQLVGVVDFGAMKQETVAGDLSRLLGSLLQYTDLPWSDGLDAYAAIRRLGDPERELVTLLDESAALLTPLQWLQWLLLDRRRFDDPRAVELRFFESFRRLCWLAGDAGSAAASIDPAKRG